MGRSRDAREGSKEMGRWREGNSNWRRAGWVARVGPGKDDQAGFSGPGQLGGHGGLGPHQRGNTIDSWHGPTLPSLAGLCFLMCVRGRGTEPTRLPCPVPTYTGSLELSGSAQLHCLGWDTELGVT